MRWIVGAILVLMVATACGGDDGPMKEGTNATAGVSTAPALAQAATTGSPTATATVMPTPTPEMPAPGIEVAFVNVDPESRVLRFAALIRNTSSKTIEGMRVRWDATDASGALVGSFTTGVPPIPAGAIHSYVGGAGSGLLTGVAQNVKLTVVEAGRLSDAPSPYFTVESVQLTREQYPIRGEQYQVSANVTTGGQLIRRADLVTGVVLKDAAGNIVGADFDRPTNLPELLPAGTKFRAEVRYIPVKAQPATAEVTSYVSPN